MSGANARHKHGGFQLFLVFMLGVLVSVPFVVVGFGFFTDRITDLAFSILAAAVTLTFISLLVVFNKQRILETLFRTASIRLEELTDPASLAIRNAMTGDVEGSVNAVDDLIRRLLARYSWIMLAKWMLAVLIAVLTVFVGLAGSALLFQQNDLLDEQNQLIVAQNAIVGQQLALVERQADAAHTQAAAAQSQLTATRLSTLNLQYDRFFGDEAFMEIVRRIEECGTVFDFANPEMGFGYGIVNRYLNFWEWISHLRRNGVLTLDDINEMFGSFIIEAFVNESLEKYVDVFRKNNDDPNAFIGFTELAEELGALPQREKFADFWRDECRKVREK